MSRAKRRAIDEAEPRTLRGSSRYTVLLSHSAEDAGKAETIALKLQSLGAEVLVQVRTKEKAEAEAWSHLLADIDACDEAVILLSSDLVTSGWAAIEIGALLGQHKHVTPVVTGESTGKLMVFPGLKALPVDAVDELLVEIRNEISQPSGQGREANALSLRGTLSSQEAERLRDETRRLRANWR